MKHTENINGPSVVGMVLVLTAIVVLAIYIADLIRAHTQNRRARLRAQRNDISIFKAAEEARRDFN